MDIVNRLNAFLSYTGLSNTQFADEAGIPRPSLSQILNGRNKKISNELISKLHQAFPYLNIMWLIFGEGNMIDSDAINISKDDADNKEHEPDKEQEEPQSGSHPRQTHSPYSSDIAVDPDFAGVADSFYISDEPIDSGESLARSEPTAYYGGRPITDYGKESSRKQRVGVKPEFTDANSTASTQADSKPPRHITSVIVLYSDNTYEVFRHGE